MTECKKANVMLLKGEAVPRLIVGSPSLTNTESLGPHMNLSDGRRSAARAMTIWTSRAGEDVNGRLIGAPDH